MDQKEFIKYLKDLAGNNQARLAHRLGISPAYLSDVLKGRRAPGKKILDAVGFDKKVEYQEKEEILNE